MKTKKVKYVLLFVAFAALLAFTAVVPVACSCTSIDAPEFEIKKIVDFANGADKDVIFETDGYGNGSVFNVEWNDENVTYEDGVAKLAISEVPETAVSEYPYYGAELRTSKWYHYGFYSVSMKPSKDSGTASTFFTYTGPYGEYDEEGNLHPWDEIDIEFLGKDTTKVQFNYYVNGNGGHEYMYDLGFDASEEFHTYGFLWEEDAITWYVDGKPVYQVTEEAAGEDGLPSTPGRIMLNHWCGTEEAEGWMGEYTGYETSVQYQWIGATSDPIEPITTPPGGDDDTPVGGVSFTPGETIALDFVNSNTSEPYTIEKSDDGKTVDVSYTDLEKAYDNIVAAVDDEDEGKNAFALTVTNNGENDANVRIDVRDNVNIVSDSSGEGYADGTPRHSCLNTVGLSREAGAEEWASAPADTEWGGSFFTVPAGKTSELVVVYDPTHFVCGNIVKDGEFSVSDITIFIDSHVDGGPFSGDVTFSKINFGTATFEEGGEQPGGEDPAPTPGGDEGEDPAPTPGGDDEGEDPVPGDTYAPDLTFTTEDGAYTVTKNPDETIDVDYTAAGAYKVISAGLSDTDKTAIAGMNAFTITVKNNKDTELKVRIDIMDTSIVIPDGYYDDVELGPDESIKLNHQCLNKEGRMEDADANSYYEYTDSNWGGSFFKIAAGETKTLTVVYDTQNFSSGAQKSGTDLEACTITGDFAVTTVNIFFDTHGGKGPYAGSATISGFEFGTVDLAA